MLKFLKNEVDKMKKMYFRCTAAILILIAFLLAMNGLRRRDEAIVSRLAPEVLRFHVLANSNSAEDQALKLAVKDYLLEEIRKGLELKSGANPDFEAHSDSEADDGSAPADPLTKDMVSAFVLDNKHSLETAAEMFITDCGFDYPVDIRLETCKFPTRVYGEAVFPAGTYDAVRVLIGDGAGENFWCVLYPSLCYLDSAYAIKKEQDSLLPQVTFRIKLADLLRKYL